MKDYDCKYTFEVSDEIEAAISESISAIAGKT